MGMVTASPMPLKFSMVIDVIAMIAHKVKKRSGLSKTLEVTDFWNIQPSVLLEWINIALNSSNNTPSSQEIFLKDGSPLRCHAHWLSMFHAKSQFHGIVKLNSSLCLLLSRANSRCTSSRADRPSRDHVVKSSGLLDVSNP